MGLRSLAVGITAALSAACASTGSSAPAGDGGPHATAQGADADAPDAWDPMESGATPVDAGYDGGAPAGEGEAGSEAGGGCAALPLCDGFEQDTPGLPPTGWDVVMGCNPNTTDTQTDGGLLVGVVSTEHHTGSHSLRVVGGDTCGYYAVETTAFAHLGPQLYARLWAMFSTGPTPNHNGFLSMTTTGGDHFRLGFQDSVVAWNAEKSDSTLPDMDTQGTSLSVGTGAATWTSWNCFEFHVDETDGRIEFWFNGQSVTGLSYDGTSTQGVDDQWAQGRPTPPTPMNLGIGWLGLNDQETAWFDDVALSSQGRIGCN